MTENGATEASGVTSQVDHSNPEVMEKIGRLERRIRYLSVAVIAIAVLGAVMLAGRLGPVLKGPRVRVSEIALMDDAGRVRGSWGTNADGDPLLSMYDRKGQTCIQMVVDDAEGHGGSLVLNTNRDNSKVFISARSTSPSGYIGTYDKDGNLAWSAGKE